MAPTRALLTAILPVVGVLWMFDAPNWVGLVILTEQYLAFIAGLAVMAGIVTKPGRLVLLDWALGVAGLASWWWLAWNYEAWLLDVLNRGPEKWVPAIIGLGTVVEATRRHCGLVLALLAVAFILYGFFGWLAPGVFRSFYEAPEKYLLYLYVDTNGVPGLVMNVGATQILGFIVFGATLNAVGGSRILTDLAMALMGNRRGGPAKVAIIASSLFGTLSGSTVANVMSTGVVTIPLMKKTGFPPRYAAAIEAVASNGGQIAPPVMGATAFVIAEFLQVPYTEVVAAALLPAVIYYYLLYRVVDQYAVAHGIEGAQREDLPRLRDAVLRSWPLLVPLGILIWFLFFRGFSPGKSALYAAGAAFALSLVMTPRDTMRAIPEILEKSGIVLIPILLVCAIAGIVIGTINFTGLGFQLTLALGQIAELGGVVALLLATAGIAILLGVGMPTTGVYIIVSVLLAPALVDQGIPMMSAHLFIFYFGLLSMLTPPVAVASYSAATIAGSDMWQTGLTGMRLAAVAYLLPFVFAFNPALLMYGTWLEVGVSAVLVAVAGHVLAEALSSARAFGGGGLRWLAGALALAVGGSTAVLEPAGTPAILLAIVSVAITVWIARARRSSAPQVKEISP